MTEPLLARKLCREARPIAGAADLDALIGLCGSARYVLLGEATHGTREFYRLRAEISRRLITEQGFDAIAVEADWPDALQASRYVQHAGSDRTADHALSGFERFPQWMWRNVEMIALLDWLRAHNGRNEQPPVGFYGIDLYSLRKSIYAVIDYLETADPVAARRARARYACFDHIAVDTQQYGVATSLGMQHDCEQQVIRQLAELSQLAAGHVRESGDGLVPDDLFYAQQNARVVQNAESYYRVMFSSRDQSWNQRDSHMADTLEQLQAHLSAKLQRPARIVVWAHNSHLGDARHTEMGWDGQLNVGQLMRERCGEEQVFILGFTTHSGTVSAASAWDAPVKLKTVLPAPPDSIEGLLHEVAVMLRSNCLLLPLRARHSALAELGTPLLERAIGVIYRPQTERLSHYFQAHPARQFDAIVHVDQSSALQPLEYSVRWRPGEVEEAYPSGL